MSHQLDANYCRSVLRIKVPVVVTLAKKKMRIERVLQLVPGVMIQFEKSCDSPMMVEVGDQTIADGEVVKIGDKFGVRIGDILQPAERFIKLADQAEKSAG